MNDEKLIDRARELYSLHSDDDLEIDDDAVIIATDDGCWVQAWVWVPTE